jgi:hypothetical protein
MCAGLRTTGSTKDAASTRKEVAVVKLKRCGPFQIPLPAATSVIADSALVDSSEPVAAPFDEFGVGGQAHGCDGLSPAAKRLADFFFWIQRTAAPQQREGSFTHSGDLALVGPREIPTVKPGRATIRPGGVRASSRR